MSNVVKALLIINTAKKGWSDAARQKASMKRKRAKSVSQMLKVFGISRGSYDKATPEQKSQMTWDYMSHLGREEMKKRAAKSSKRRK